MQTGEEYVLQGVRSIYELREVDPSEGARRRQNVVGAQDGGKIVLIGKGLDERVLRSFEGIFSSTDVPAA